MTSPTATTVAPTSASSHATVKSATTALRSLLQSGISLHDARVETLLSLILRCRAAHPSPSHCSNSLTASPTLPPNASQSDAPTATVANSFSGVPPTLLPVAARHPTSMDRSFLTHNQTTVVVSRLALELSHTPSTNRPPTTPPQISPSSPTLTATPPRTSRPQRPNAPPASVFQAARAASLDHRRQISKRKDPKSPGRFSASSRSCTSPRRRPSTPSMPADRPFSAQTCADVSAHHAFQIKAQAEAFRRLIRGVDIPHEIAVAARGRPPTLIAPLPAPVLRRGVSDPDAATSFSMLTDPCLEIQPFDTFDPRRLPRFPPNHVFEESDVRMVGEQNVSAEELAERVLIAQVHHDRLHARHIAECRTERRVEPCTHTFDSVDAKVRQQREQIITSLRTPKTTGMNGEAPPSMSLGRPPHLSFHPAHKPPSQDRKINRNCDRLVSAKRHHSALLDRAAMPIAVSSTPSRTPSYAMLLQTREKQITNRTKIRLQEIQDMLPMASDDVQRALLIEQKQLNLLPLQQKLRKSVMKSMHGLLHRPGVADISAGRIAKTRLKMSTRNASARGISGAAAHGGSQSAEASYRVQQQTRRQARRSSMLNALLNHTTEFRSAAQQRTALKKRLMKDLERFFRERSREEERRRKKEQMDRLRALRNNNEDEYLELLKTTKNKRLIQLLRQTDEYLMQIGAQVERQKQEVRDIDERSPGGDNAADVKDEDKEDHADEQCDADELSQLKKRRNDYYTITHTISEKVHQPKSLVNGTLKPYQLEGLEWLVSLYNNNLNGILADEMGLGKTIQTLSLICYLVEVKNVQGPFLVIVPLSVISNWMRELERWAPSLVAVVYKGDPATRKNIQLFQMQGGSYNIVLTTYEYVVKDKNVLGRIRWKYIIMDEGHRMKNADCKLALTLGAKYTSRNRLLLTGTPLQNNMTELWALLNFLLPTIFSSAETFETWFNAPFQSSALSDSAELNEEENLLIISRLHQVLRPFMLRRLKTDVESQLPDKVEIVFRCDMSIWQHVLYRQMRAKLGIAGGAGSSGLRSFNNTMMQLKKVCNHPFLFYHDEELMSLPPDFLMRAAGKFELLDHVLRKLKRSGHRVLIFSQMTAVLDYLEFFLSRIGMTHLRLDGTTKADDRQAMLEMFNAEGSEYFCFLLSTRAGGLGLNLQTADTVIIFDSDWNPMMDLQAQDRAHRIGQTKEVRVYRLICSGTVEVKILERATRKLQIESQVIQAGQFNNKSSDNDRHEMLKDLLKQKSEDETAAAKQDVTSLEEINRNLARGDFELDLFECIDRELQDADCGRARLLEREDELPKWVLKPEEEVKSKETVEAEYILEHGRGRRKRKQVVYDDNLTEREWAAAMEEEGDIENAVRRKRRKRKSTANEDDVEILVGNEMVNGGEASSGGGGNGNDNSNGNSNDDNSVIAVDDDNDDDDDDDDGGVRSGGESNSRSAEKGRDWSPNSDGSYEKARNGRAGSGQVNKKRGRRKK